MLQSYKLRLGDGTVLVVDHGGLSIWLVDRKAMVQPVGSHHWKPLKGFLAQERSAAARAARHQPKPPSTSRDALPLVYPKPREEPASGPPAPRAPAEQPPGSRGRDKEPIPVRADGLPLIPPPPKPSDDPDSARRRPTPAPPVTVVRPSLPKPPAPPVLRKPTPPEAPPRATVVRPSLPKAAPAPVLARQPAEPHGGDTKPTADSELPRISLTPPVIPPPPILSPTPILSPPTPTLSPPSTLSPTPPTLSLTPPILSLTPPILSPTPPILSPPPPTPSPTPTLSPTPRDNRDNAPRRPAHSLPPAPLEPPAEPKESVPPLLPPDEDVGWMALPKPLDKPHDDEPPALSAASRRDPLEPSFASARPSLLQEARLWLMSQAASAYGALLALWKSLARGDRSLPSFSPGEPVPWRAVDSKPGVRVQAQKGKGSLGVYSPRRSTDDGLPILQLEPLDDPEGKDSLGVYSPQTSTDDGLPILQLEPLDDGEDTNSSRGSSSGRSTADDPEIILEPLDDEVPAARVPRQVRSRPPVPLREPTEPAASRSAGGAPSEELKLPHLAPETIRLIQAKSATAVLDAPAVFRVTCDAADRGSWVLTPEEVQELRALRRELLDALLPSEAERVLEYDGARARRATFPLENRAALDLFARGANALPSRSRARLQVLFGKAVAAQLRAKALLDSDRET